MLSDEKGKHWSRVRVTKCVGPGASCGLRVVQAGLPEDKDWDKEWARRRDALSSESHREDRCRHRDQSQGPQAPSHPESSKSSRERTRDIAYGIASAW